MDSSKQQARGRRPRSSHQQYQVGMAGGMMVPQMPYGGSYAAYSATAPMPQYRMAPQSLPQLVAPGMMMNPYGMPMPNMVPPTGPSGVQAQYPAMAAHAGSYQMRPEQLQAQFGLITPSQQDSFAAGSPERRSKSPAQRYTQTPEAVVNPNASTPYLQSSVSMDYTKSGDSFARASSQSMVLPALKNTYSGKTGTASGNEGSGSWFSRGARMNSGPGQVGNFIDHEEFEYTFAAQVIIEKVREIKNEINEMHAIGNKRAREEAINDLITIVNNEVNELNLNHDAEQRSATHILLNCVKILDECRINSGGLEMYSYFYYDTYNNLARIQNIDGNIEGSLYYLLIAYEHTKYLSTQDPTRGEDLVESTIVPELLMNICNAQIYVQKYMEAIKTAREAFNQSQIRMTLLTTKIRDLQTSNEDKDRFTALYDSQCQIHVRSQLAVGQAYQHMKRYEEAVVEYNKGKDLVQMYYGRSHILWGECLHLIQTVHDDLKLDDDAVIERERQKFERQREELQKLQKTQDDFFQHQIVELQKQRPKEEIYNIVAKKADTEQSISINTKKKSVKYVKRGRRLVTAKKRQKSQNNTASNSSIYYNGPSMRLPVPGSFYNVLKRDPNNDLFAASPVKKEKKKVVKIIKKVDNKNEKMMIEIQKLQNEMQKNDLDSVDDQIKIIQKKADDNNTLLLKSLDEHKQLFMRKQEEANDEDERIKREMFLEDHKCTDWKCQECNPPPPIHPEHGHPVYDPHFKCWTYPYATRRASPKKEKPPSPPKMVDCATLADYYPEEVKPETAELPTQTIKEIQTQTTTDVEIQTFHLPERGTQQSPKRASMSKWQAYEIIARWWRKLLVEWKMRAYRNQEGCLFCRHYNIGQNSGALEILSVFMIYKHLDGKCLHLKFTVFDYVTKKFMYQGTYEQLDHVYKFNVHVLHKLCKASLGGDHLCVPFERAPFIRHIGIIQSVINHNLPEEVEIPDWKLCQSDTESSTSSSEESVEPSPIVIEEPLPEATEIEIQTDPIPEPESPTTTETVITAETPELPPPKRIRMLWAIIYIQRRVRRWLHKIYTFHRLPYRELVYEFKKIERPNPPVDSSLQGPQLAAAEAQREKQQRFHTCGNRSFTFQLWRYFEIYRTTGDYKNFRDYLMNRKVTHYMLCAFEDKLSPCQKHKKAHYVLNKRFGNVIYYQRSFKELRLPQNYAEIVEYMNFSAYLEFDVANPCVIRDVNLLRLKVKDQWNIDLIPVPVYDPYPSPVPLYESLPIKQHVPIYDMENDENNKAVLKLMFEFEQEGDKMRCCVYRRARWAILDAKSRAEVQALRSNGEALRVQLSNMHRTVTPLHESSPTFWKEDKIVEWEEATKEGQKTFSSVEGMRKYKDWKIKVEQINPPKSSDYLVVFKLPCSLSKLEAFLRKNLTVAHETRAHPQPISYLCLRINGEVAVGSQTQYDQKYYRHDQLFGGKRYLSQNYGVAKKSKEDGKYHSLSRLPQVTLHQDGAGNNIVKWRLDNSTKDPLYELYTQQYKPHLKYPNWQAAVKDVRMYQYPVVNVNNDIKAELAHPLCDPMAEAVRYSKQKAEKRQQAVDAGKVKPWDSCEYDWYSSEEDDDNDDVQGCDPVEQAWAWDAEQLFAIQLDAVTILKSYVKLTVSNTIRKEDQCLFFINTAAVKWPATQHRTRQAAAKLEKDEAAQNNNEEDEEAAELEEGEADSILQYLADCLRLTQSQAPYTKEIELRDEKGSRDNAMYLDLTTADRYRNYATYAQGVTAANPEHFMAQDLAKWTNQDFAVSIYNMVNDEPDDPKVQEQNIKVGYVIECVKIDEPKMRAYLYLKPEELPAELRGSDLQDYIDGAVELHAAHEDCPVDASRDSRIPSMPEAHNQQLASQSNVNQAGKQQRLTHITLTETAAAFWAALQTDPDWQRRQQEKAAELAEWNSKNKATN